MPRRSHTTKLTLDFGERLRSLRQEAGMSLAQLANVTGISKGHLSTIELGFAAITIESVEKLAEGLDVSPMYLMAFPKKDEYAFIAELVRRLPTTHMKKLRKQLKTWVGEMEKRN